MRWFIEAVVKNYGTTILGGIIGLAQVVYPICNSGRWPTSLEWFTALLFVIIGAGTKFVRNDNTKS